MTSIHKDYKIILSTFWKYLPSRFLVILNSIFIIPFFAYMLSATEMATYQIIIESLNLLCTCSTDWISKSALRFYEKYKLQNKLSEFFSSIVTVSAITYLFIILFYVFFADYVSAKLFIPKDLLVITIILIIPCGLRQFLYQLLRIFNKPFLYTSSIIIYQFAHLLLFLLLFNLIGNVKAILIAMIIAMVVIDILIISKIKLKTELRLIINFKFMKEALQYSLPTIITNSCIWLLFDLNKFIFQNLHMLTYTAIAGITWRFISCIFTPLCSTFLFAIFPILIKKYENHQDIKSIETKTIQLFCTLLIPLMFTFILFPKEIINTIFSHKYTEAFIIIPFFAFTLFMHEFMKILNIKYHLKNKTYIEMAVTFIVGIICIILNIVLIPKYKLLGAGISMATSISLLFIIHSLIRFKDLQYTYPNKIFKTIFSNLAITFIIFATIKLGTSTLVPNHLQIIDPLAFISLNYIVIWNLKHKILT